MAEQQRSTGGTLDSIDALHRDLSAVQAILDCAKVLTALERATAIATNGGGATGLGYADGYLIADASLPDLLAHGTDLVREIRSSVDCLDKSVANEEREVRHG